MRTARIAGSDASREAVELAQRGVDAAGLGRHVRIERRDLRDAEPPWPDAGLVVTNPPYGERMGEQQELAAFYPKFGDLLKQKFAGWNCYILSADMNLPRLIKLQVSRRTPLFNGALECRLFEYKIVAGSMRGPKPVKA